MKRAYVKPAMEIENFQLNQSIATNCLNTTTNTQLKAVTVYCLKDLDETIFTQGTSGCTNITSFSSSQIVNYNGSTYYIWPFGSGYQPTPSAHNTEMEGVLAAAGIQNPSDGGYHVGILDGGDIKIINAS